MMPFSKSGIRNGVFVLKESLDMQFHKPMINAQLTEPCDHTMGRSVSARFCMGSGRYPKLLPVLVAAKETIFLN
jgi:hypothetical protein